MKKILTILVVVMPLVMSACAGVSYNAEDWSAPNADSDWDIASAVCDDRANKRELTEDEIAQIEIENKAMSDAMDRPSYGYDTAKTSAEVIADLTIGMIIGSAKTRKLAEVKDDEFADCMRERGWQENQ